MTEEEKEKKLREEKKKHDAKFNKGVLWSTRC